MNRTRASAPPESRSSDAASSTLTRSAPSALPRGRGVAISVRTRDLGGRRAPLLEDLAVCMGNGTIMTACLTRRPDGTVSHARTIRRRPRRRLLSDLQQRSPNTREPDACEPVLLTTRWPCPPSPDDADIAMDPLVAILTAGEE